uniref:RNase H type-1 domain-containing protein n=1 Tax=viral metagenome TaxID=1070528 RepID=A0A6C0IJ30_9ZZZZ
MKYYYLRGTKHKYECNLLQFKSSSSSCGIIIMSKKEDEYRTPHLEYGFYTKETQNINESEFYALFKGLEYALENDMYDLMVEGDSLLVIESIISKKKINLKKPYSDYLEKIKMYISIFNTFGIRYICKERNDEAEYLADVAFTYKKNFETKYFD